MTTRIRVVAQLLAATAIAGGVLAAPASGARQAEAEPLAAAQAVLDAREESLIAGDAAAWMETVDPRASQDFRSAQRRQFDGLRRVPLSRFDLAASTNDTGDLAPPGLEARYGARVFVPETRQTYRFEGFDDRDQVDALWLTFVERDGRWYVGGDTDLEAVGLDTARGLWDTGAVEIRPTAHFLVLSHPAQADRAEALAAIAEEAIALLDTRWDKPWSGRIPMVLPGSVEELEVLLQSTIDLDKFVAFVAYGAVEDDDFLYTAPRIYIQDRNLSRYGRAFQVETLLHELSHAAAVPIAGPTVPAWVHEGVADWIATGRGTRERRPDGSDGFLPRDHEFTTGAHSSILRSYAESRSAIAYLARRRGAGAPTAFFDALGKRKVAAGNLDYHVDQALQEIGAGRLADFERGWGGR